MTAAIDLAALAPVRLAHLGALLASGADARAFLQGQLSADLGGLAADRVLLASCNSVQGRVQAVLWLLERTDGIALVLPASMLETIAARLRKYVLRSKVSIDAKLLGVAAIDRPTPASAALSAERSHLQHAEVSFVRLDGRRQVLVLAPSILAGEADVTAELAWRRADIAAGLPQVYPATHEAFVAQMLNLDALDGVSFTKGCYTGQEIIARAHYRGAVKRRMFRYSAPGAPPAPGARIVLGEQHAGEVVDAAPTENGCELLAVVSLAHASDANLSLESGPCLTRLELPYPV